ncbi:sulfur oxidation c-type cytochrome SoxA [Sulfurihydrogenibium azorense]|jgi:sulfur-oxidizing protein SoxA|uniref:SoxAX cytochrome complex subunit A n=1 Tax=Sulfurihydrogenibium azorense (strain DSM 15241 / OCM 825 / Az-Fu1) TaxID=204536 RepID=C1DX05_SULAA|nr:sulfur oxidation c-type cytochrome SoxA [Sulfurihydrogenibium azorense]ACN99195.1 diheme cytochrome SoxA [Sulfurihydrogenibium azorense Az-Fu1]
MKLKGKVLLFGLAVALTTYGVNKSISQEAGQAISEEDLALYKSGINPGEVFAQEVGGALFNKPMGTSNKSCASCHSEEKLKKAVGTYPKYEPKLNTVISLQQRIQMCQKLNQGVDKPFPLNSQENTALLTYLKYIASGEKINVDTSSNPVVKEYYEYGKYVFDLKRGKRNLSCQTCHEFAAGMVLRMQRLTPLGAEYNGIKGTNAAAHWPGYRMTQSKVVTIEQRFQQCMSQAGMKILPLGSKEMVALELYVTSLANGATIEAPGLVR